uniref:Uncharacterized protein n=1 Tax=Cacopsylla melanoneura TaxID=428564 RepID=A0A8D9BFJ0_9HEMI
METEELLDSVGKEKGHSQESKRMSRRPHYTSYHTTEDSQIRHPRILQHQFRRHFFRVQRVFSRPVWRCHVVSTRPVQGGASLYKRHVCHVRNTRGHETCLCVAWRCAAVQKRFAESSGRSGFLRCQSSG